MMHAGQPVRLDALKMAWLQEIGLDRRLLQRYADTTPVPAPAGHGAAAGAGADVPPAAVRAPAPGNAHAPMAGADAAPQAVAQAPTAAPHEGAAAARAGRSAAQDILRVLRDKRGAELPAPVDGQGDGAPGADGVAAPPAVVAVTDPVQALGAGQGSSLDGVQATVLACQACALHGDRTVAVPGTGVAQSPDWLVVGEAPGGADERAGVPFQGRAGDLLRAMLSAAGVAPTEQVFYTNAVKCRPLSNRPPSPEEVAQCLPYLQRQIALLQPARILALGRVAATALLGQQQELDALRGKVWHYADADGRQVPVVVTYHPGWLLAHPQQKEGAWRDLLLARQALHTPDA